MPVIACVIAAAAFPVVGVPVEGPANGPTVPVQSA